MFYALKNLFALIGVIALAVLIYAFVKFQPLLAQWDSFDPKAGEVYTEMMTELLETGNSASATVWKRKVEDGLSWEEVEQTMRFVANEHNIKNVGELPLSNEVAAITGEDSRFFKIYMFCNPMTAANMLEYSDAYSAYLPCRVSLVEDNTGALWIYTLNMDAMIYGGKPLPEDLKEEAIAVKDVMLDIMERGATGAF